MLEHYGASIGNESPYLEAVKARVITENPSIDQNKEEYMKKVLAAARHRSIATAFLKRADQRRYGGLWSELENSYTRGQDHYPVDLTNAYNVLLNYRAAPAPRQNRRESQTDMLSGASFLQKEKDYFQDNKQPMAGTDGVTHKNVKCYNCQFKGHYSNDCPVNVFVDDTPGVQMLQVAGPDNTTCEPYESEFSFVQVGSADFTFTQANNGYNIIPSTWILLDSQSTVSVFKNRSLVTNIRPSTRQLRVYTNGGTQVSRETCTLKNFGNVWFNAQSLANILSLAEVRRICRVTMDTSVEAAMHVHRADGTIMKFQEYRTGLYYFDTDAPTLINTTKTNLQY